MAQKTYHIKVTVESSYVEDQSVPEANRYLFAYTINLENRGLVAAKLLTRHWIITDANGKVQEVRGEGVVGEQPHLEPTETFRYTSAAMIETPVGTMQGSYQMRADDGLRFDAPIEIFRLSVPNILN